MQRRQPEVKTTEHEQVIKVLETAFRQVQRQLLEKFRDDVKELQNQNTQLRMSLHRHQPFLKLVMRYKEEISATLGNATNVTWWSDLTDATDISQASCTDRGSQKNFDRYSSGDMPGWCQTGRKKKQQNSYFQKLNHPGYAGAVCNATLEELKAARMVTREGRTVVIISVAEHKTGREGHAKLLISMEAYKQLQQYLKCVQPLQDSH